MIVLDVEYVFDVADGVTGVLALFKATLTPAEMAGLTYGQVQMWRSRGAVPTKYALHIVHALVAKGHKFNTLVTDNDPFAGPRPAQDFEVYTEAG